MAFSLPEDVFSGLRSSPDHFAAEMRLADAIKWYEVGRVSHGKAAEVAGLSRFEAVDSLERFNVSPFRVIPISLWPVPVVLR